MKQASFYNKDGEIVGTIFATEEDIEMNIPSGCSVVDGLWSDELYWVKDGEPTAYTPEQVESIAARPHITSKWSNKLMAWEDSRSLEQLKEAKWEEMKERRLAALLAPLETPFGVFDADEKGAMNIKDTISLQAALVSVGMPSEVSFTLADDSEVSLSQQQMLTVGILLGARTQEIYTKGRALRVRVDAATSPGELGDIFW